MTKLTSKTDRLQARYIPKNARCILEHENGSALYTYEIAGKFYAIAFRGTSAKSDFHYSYRTDAQRQEQILRWKAAVEASAQFKAERAAEKAAWSNPLKAGDILYTSWGYDQTNVEFFAVTKVSGRRIWVREIASDYEATGFMSGKTWPAMPIRFIGDETMHTAQPSGQAGAYIRISECRIAHLETGREHHTSSYA